MSSDAKSRVNRIFAARAPETGVSGAFVFSADAARRQQFIQND
jgi:hypothetical protein